MVSAAWSTAATPSSRDQRSAAAHQRTTRAPAALACCASSGATWARSSCSIWKNCPEILLRKESCSSSSTIGAPSGCACSDFARPCTQQAGKGRS